MPDHAPVAEGGECPLGVHVDKIKEGHPTIPRGMLE
jgi:hypothetical protein